MSTAENLMRIRERIARAAGKAGVSPDGITLVGVTKFQEPEVMREAQIAGLCDFGENYPQHFDKKFPLFTGIRWHFIGHLQTNKVKLIVGRSSLVQSVDSERLLAAIERFCAEKELTQSVLIQVNIGREPQKDGVLPEDLESLLEAACGCPHIRVKGLMAVPPRCEDPEESRPYFAEMRGLWERYKGSDPRIAMEVLSMGMSHDFEQAILEGAGMVRVGTAIFGARPSKQELQTR